jgi:hypothetical protein
LAYARNLRGSNRIVGSRRTAAFRIGTYPLDEGLRPYTNARNDSVSIHLAGHGKVLSRLAAHIYAGANVCQVREHRLRQPLDRQRQRRHRPGSSGTIITTILFLDSARGGTAAASLSAARRPLRQPC